MIKLFLAHYREMMIGQIKGLILRIFNPKRYTYLKDLRGDYKILNRSKSQLVKEIKEHLRKNQITDFTLISRIKTIGSVDRKDRYIKTLNKKGDHGDAIGIKIITKDKTDCYKIMNILITDYELQTGENLINPEDFFKNEKLMRNTNSIARNHIFVKIIFEGIPVHFILMPKLDYKYIHQQRKIYLRFVYHTIKNKQ